MTLTKSFKLRDIRESMGYGMAELAEKAGVTEPTIRNIEDGKSCSYITLVLLAKALRVPLATLTGDQRITLGQVMRADGTWSCHDRFHVISNDDGLNGDYDQAAMGGLLRTRPRALYAPVNEFRRIIRDDEDVMELWLGW